MTYRSLSELRGGDPEAYYLAALRYGNTLWLAGHSGRAILAATRALYADLPEDAAVLREWPLPYRALRWIVAQHPSDDFPGNPRVSFQHQATRLRGERQELRRARAWAVWALVRAAKPSLPGDAAQEVEEPDLEAIRGGLETHGHADEASLWADALGET
jgi:hypothetical protein